MIINDDEAISRYLADKLSSEIGSAVEYVSNCGLGFEKISRKAPDAVILKHNMPDFNNEAVVRGIKELDPDSAIILFVEEPDTSVFQEINRLSIYDFISLPINLDRLFLLVRKASETHALSVSHRKVASMLKEQNNSLQKQNVLLAKRIEESAVNLTRLYGDLRSTYMRTIKVLAQAIDARDHYTHSHSESVARYAVAIANEMHLSAKEVDNIRDACELHDLGKIGIEDRILSKTSGLSPEEWDQMRRHPSIAAQMLEPLTFLGDVVNLIKQHHERFDGKGYPMGLKGEQILLGARIINLADAYDSMRSSRSYRQVPLSKEDAVAEIKKHTGVQFDPKVAEVFLKIVDKL